MEDTLHQNIFAPDPQPRFKLIHTLTGQTVARADLLQEFRDVIDQQDAHFFTLHDLKESQFTGASIIWKDKVKL